MKYYHISHEDNLEFLFPRVPVDIAPMENETTPRVCLAPSINQCLMAKEPYSPDVFVVYIVDDPSFSPCFLTVKDVPDVERTGEVWSLLPIDIKKIGTIKVISEKVINRILFYKWRWIRRNQKILKIKTGRWKVDGSIYDKKMEITAKQCKL